jgi:hypothetical protein
MGKKLEIGEKVLMFKLIYEKGVLDVLNSIVYNIPKEVTVKSRDNVLGYDVITVEDELGDEYCGSHVLDRHLGHIALAKRDEYVNGLLNTYTKYFAKGYERSITNAWWTSEEAKIFRAINHQVNCVCDHLFVMQSKGYWCGGCHSTDYEYENSTVTCVHCGLTNRWSIFERYDAPFHTKLRNEAFSDFLNVSVTKDERYYRGDESVVTNHLLSKRVYFFDEPRHLYNEAKEQKPDATNEELFDLMIKIEKEEFARNRKSWEDARKKEETNKTKKKVK